MPVPLALGEYRVLESSVPDVSRLWVLRPVQHVETVQDRSPLARKIPVHRCRIGKGDGVKLRLAAVVFFVFVAVGLFMFLAASLVLEQIPALP
jgi:hypothetical protein